MHVLSKYTCHIHHRTYECMLVQCHVTWVHTHTHTHVSRSDLDLINGDSVLEKFSLLLDLEIKIRRMGLSYLEIKILLPNTKISKEAKEIIHECALEFVSFVTGKASDKCHKKNLKTDNGHHVC
ncbi:hypothetical protein LguiA_026415 [Lonicera macranthoides]